MSGDMTAQTNTAPLRDCDAGCSGESRGAVVKAGSVRQGLLCMRQVLSAEVPRLRMRTGGDLCVSDRPSPHTPASAAASSQLDPPSLESLVRMPPKRSRRLRRARPCHTMHLGAGSGRCGSHQGSQGRGDTYPHHGQGGEPHGIDSDSEQSHLLESGQAVEVQCWTARHSWHRPCQPSCSVRPSARPWTAQAELHTHLPRHRGRVRDGAG
jgi:hypothetical protein